MFLIHTTDLSQSHSPYPQHSSCGLKRFVFIFLSAVFICLLNVMYVCVYTGTWHVYMLVCKFVRPEIDVSFCLIFELEMLQCTVSTRVAGQQAPAIPVSTSSLLSAWVTGS